MAADVIDLVSSSPLPDLPRTQASGTTLTAAPTRLPRPKHHGHSTTAEDLAEFADEFDTTGDIDPPAAQNPGGFGQTPARGTQPRPVPDTIDLLSDDFGSTSEIDRPALAQCTGNKRRRVSKSPTACGTSHPGSDPPDQTDPACLAVSATRPSPAAVGDPGGHATRLPPLSSDPFASSPPVRPRSPLQEVVTSADLPRHKSLSDAARRVSGQDGGLRGRPADSTAALPAPVSSDPFASSPVQAPNARGLTSRRNLSDIDISSPGPAQKNPTHRRRQAWDPISSSAPEATTPAPRQRSEMAHTDIINIDSDSECENGGTVSADDLPDVDSLARMPLKARSPLRRSRSDMYPSAVRGRVSKSAARGAQSRNPNKKPSAEKAAEKEAEKERKRQERQAAKDAKMREKERAAALAEANKMRTDKKVSTREMIVDLPSCLSSSIRMQTVMLLEDMSVEHTTWDATRSVVKWRRKVTSRFDADAGHWEPIPPRIVSERQVAVILEAVDFVALAVNDGVGGHVEEMRGAFPGHQLIYLLEGMTPWMRKNRSIKNRQFAKGVRSQDTANPNPTAGRRRNAPPEEVVEEGLVEEALVELQVVHDVLIHHTSAPLDTAKWLAVLTQHTSTIPYRKQREDATLGAGFCMETGQVKTGDSVGDTYICMLQEIARVTAPIAYGVAAEFGSVTKLVNGLEVGGPGRLDAVRKTVNKDGALSDRTVGQAVSRRMHKVFTGRDESSTDV